ncbi:MAG: DNA topoisomerase IV subunit A [Planctomycetes bacterium]|nr:DNA topoisomerase IV subunit A [Planctomycetota bacterium]
MAQLEPLMQRNFLEYASYVVMDRAIPDIRDGLKPVQRRILHTLREMDDGRFHKVANVIGEAMKLHPHGDAPIRDALVVLANKGYFIERQGNFGNVLTGHPAAAARYIECRLTDLAREALFNKPLTRFTPSYDGRREEPVFLPAKLPVLLMLGPEGIAVGMATRILPHNLGELLAAQIGLLEGREGRVQPDFPQGGIMDVSEYDDGRGKVMLRARIARRGDKKVVISELPYSTTTESLIGSIEAAAQRGQVKIASLNDYTTDKVEIELALQRGVYADEVIPQLYAYTDCEVSISSNIVAICGGRPEEMTVTQVLAFLTDQLLQQVKAELEHDLARQQDKLHWLTLEQIFIENRVYKRIEKAKTDEEVRRQVWEGMQQHALFFVRPMVEEDVERLLQIRIRRISAYDIARNRADLKEARQAIKELERRLANLKQTTIDYLKGMHAKYAAAYPRRTEIKKFESVDRRDVARQDLRVSYDPESGFFGTKVRGAEHQVAMSEFDKVLVVTSDGTYRVMGPVDKVLLPGKVLHCGLFDPEQGERFTVVYRDRERIAWGKKVHIQSFIKDKVYDLVPVEGGRLDVLAPTLEPGPVHLAFVPAKRQRVAEATFDLDGLEVKGVAARGNRLAPKPVARVSLVGRRG